ncbi:MAG: FAD-binding protein [Actinomycetales bacterium]|nr:MAG: FAD-binding protein [Actinomycetales bacterium]
MSFAAELEQLLGVALITDPDITATYSKDQALFAASAPAAAVLLARNTEEISKALAFCSQRNIPVVTRGAGSGLSGGANADSQSLVISLEKMNEILEINPDNQFARVQAGVINLDLDTAVKRFGMAYLPDPASRDWSTLGGNVATNAGGMCCVKYGVTSHHVRALTVVLSTGEVIKVGKSTKKFVTTLDLLHLFIGSEGTLGIITEITLNLVPRPNTPATLIATFPSITEAAAASTQLLKYRPSMLEIIDQTTLRAVEEWHPLGFEVAGSILLMQLDENFELGEQALDTCNQHSMIDGMFTSDSSEATDLIRVRKLAYPALERLGATLLDDVAIPVTKIAEFVSQVGVLALRHSLTIGIFGHAGDGNMHPTIVHAHGDVEGEKRAKSAFSEIVQIAQALGGTASGEHGIGSIKRELVTNEISAKVIEIQRGIKMLLDPSGILNPGKKLP